MAKDADYMIRVEDIKELVLVLSAGQDCMLPSELICKSVCKRLEENHFLYPFEHKNDEVASHYLSPVRPLTAKMFQVKRKCHTTK